LHDDLGALLTASKIQIGQIERFTEKDSKAFTFVQLSGEMVDESIDRLGAIARSLVPPTLERFGIKDALKEYTGQFSYSDQPKFDISVVNRRFDTPVELGLFRMIQELVNNTLKYAQANHITISITENQNWLKLEYSDNGIGFDIESAQRGLGLRNLEGRSHILGGSCQLESTMGNGMRATIRIRNKKQGEI
jgi:signal transduction histidine kinase